MGLKAISKYFDIGMQVIVFPIFFRVFSTGYIPYNDRVKYLGIIDFFLCNT
jgi:hypothetical protein